MQVRIHREITERETDRPYYFRKWHYCPKCKFLKHFEKYKVFNETDELTEEYLKLCKGN